MQDLLLGIPIESLPGVDTTVLLRIHIIMFEPDEVCIKKLLSLGEQVLAADSTEEVGEDI
jgi:hypothetical protein